ncbi:hypothetical protein [Ramlibacter sp. PS4R-6]|uniref:hypothetical protein n=1 Tax=Ramlibacter sp. PS4R-6 TaxID=3133438 RepID=UPI003094D554
MSMDLLPLKAFSLESRPAPAAAPAEGHTLTLQLRTAPGAMAGRLALREPAAAAPDTVRVRVAPAPQEPLYFTR